MRFSSPHRRSDRKAPAKATSGPRLGNWRVLLLISTFLLVLLARQRLSEPTTYRAIGNLIRTVSKTDTTPSDLAPAIDPSLLATIEDNTFFRDEEQEAWFALIDRLRADEPINLHGLATPVGYAELNSQPDSYRARPVRVLGAVQRVEEVQPAPNDLGVERLYRSVLQPEGGGVWPLFVYTLEPPPPIDADSFAPYQASAVGYFFKKLSYRWSEGVGIAPVIVAVRLSDQPASAVIQDTTAEAEQSDYVFESLDDRSLGRALLQDLGVDLQAMEQVQDQRPLTAQDSAVFYGVLDAVAETPATQLVRLAQVGREGYLNRLAEEAGASLREQQTLRAARKEAERGRYSVASLFGDTGSLRGELLVFDAIVRRAVRIDASRSDHAVEQYYELEAFPEDSQNLPLVFCVRDLPAGFPLGESIRQPARLAGFFFKQWAYRTRKPADASGREDRRQFAPLLIGRAPIMLATPDSPGQSPGLVVGLSGAAMLLLTVVFLWRQARGDRRHAETTVERLRRSPDRDFSQLG